MVAPEGFSLQTLVKTGSCFRQCLLGPATPGTFENPSVPLFKPDHPRNLVNINTRLGKMNTSLAKKKHAPNRV